MTLTLTDQDVQLMLAEVQRFCQRTIAPLVERPERLITTEQLRQLTRQAIEMGLINLEREAAAGLWENLDTEWGRRFSSSVLCEVARVNAGIALHFHQLALGGFLRRWYEIGGGEPTIVCLQGRYGLARQSLARLLQGKGLHDDDVQLLLAYFVTLDGESPPPPLLFPAADDWRELLAPTFNAQQEFGWALFKRDDSSVTPIAHSHGVNETLTWQWTPSGSRACQRITDGDCLQSFAAAMNINAQALVAIGEGALRQASAKASVYAATRKQAARLLNQHAAVQQMLANCSSTVQTVEFLRQKMADMDLRPENLGKVLGVRAQTHDLLCAAANDALQVLGGIGYMQDTGLEKIVRDNNHLRLLHGTPTELRLFLAEWENAT